MTQEGFENYLHSVYGYKSGAVNSYIMAIHIIDELFVQNDVFALRGQSLATIEDESLLVRIVEFICEQQSLYKKGDDSFFSNVKSNQTSYPARGFCSAGIKQLYNYQKHAVCVKKAENVVLTISKGSKVSSELISIFDINKEGRDKVVATRHRLGQDYFRKMVLANYQGRCCVTGFNVPQTLRASHIVAWADDTKNRMNPENGLCLSATYDAAFDEHLISFDDDYRMIVSKVIKDYYTNDVTKQYFKDFEGKQILLPIRFMPNKKLLERHRNQLVV